MGIASRSARYHGGINRGVGVGVRGERYVNLGGKGGVGVGVGGERMWESEGGKKY